MAQSRRRSRCASSPTRCRRAVASQAPRHPRREASSISRMYDEDAEYPSKAWLRSVGFRSACLLCPCSAMAARSVRSASPAPSQRVLRAPDRDAPDLRRPGGDRDREHAAVQRAGDAQPRPDRIAGAADSDQRDPARDQPVANATCCRCSRRSANALQAVRRPAQRSSRSTAN